LWLSGAIIGTARITGTSPSASATTGRSAVRNQTPIMSRQADAVYPAAISVDDPGLRGQYVKLAHWYLGRRRPSS
jgi:hypothetical protein